MRENDAFLQAILADPDNDAPRLNYADWLDEHGDVRGEFIRVQCTLAKMAKEDPRRAELELRERELLAGHREAWLRELPSWWWDEITCEEFERGFIAGVQTTFDAFRAHVEELFRLVPVDRVCFENIQATDAPALADSPHLARLTGLSFWDDRSRLVTLPTYETIATALAASPYLTRLTGLGFDFIDDAGLTALAGSSNLRRLTSLRLGEGNIGCRGGGFSPGGIATLVASPHLTKLTKLSICNFGFEREGRGLGDACAAALAASPQLAALTELRLFSMGIRAEGVAALAASSHLSRLTSLDLYWNWIGPEGAVALAASPHLTRLTSLELCDGWIGAEGAAALAGSPQLSQLAYLGLWANRIGERGAVALVTSPYLRRLRSLALGMNELGDEGAAALAAAFQLPELKSLDLCDNRFGDAGAVVLATSPRLTHLSRLDLRAINYHDKHANHIGDAGAIALATSPYVARLTRLYLDYNPLGSRGQQALLARFGDPFGKLVRVESELTRLAPDDPRRARLEGRKARLLAAGALPEDTELTLERVSDQGVAEEVVTDVWVFLDRAEALFQAVPSLQHVSLQVDWLEETVARLAASPYLARLTTLDLSDNPINDAGAQALAASPHLVHLTTLDLHANRIGDVGAEALAASPYLARLTTLDLSGNPIRDRGERALRARFGEGVVWL